MCGRLFTFMYTDRYMSNITFEVARSTVAFLKSGKNK